ncbi:GNAT family N-acetyltransferase [Inquilinus sp. OTU3971]|uniref:GNAT family N-acetyltransferase n=1 Tax=Inquilinus sp. OTU3971 TaxID=3043855 RepID=UPI00313B52A2
MTTTIATLETRRLLLRPLDFADAPAVQRLFPQWEIVRHLNARVPWPYPPDGALVHLRDVLLPSMARGGAWHWSLRLRTAPDELIGCISLRADEVDENRGFWLGLPWHGQGLMTEASDRVTDYWFDDLGFPVLRMSKAVENAASRRISEKCGMRVIATVERDYVSGRLISERWEITREEWRAYRRQAAGG